MATDARHRVLAAGLVLVSLLAPPAAAQVWPVCGSSGNYAANSIYQANLRRLSATLPINASGEALFARATVGAVPDVAYALALCRGDSNASTCESCVATALLNAQQLCPYNKDAAAYLDGCNVRFSDDNFLATTATTDSGSSIAIGNPQNASTVDEFDAAVGVLLNATADYAAANSSRRFATVEAATRDSSFTIYGLAQCTPDMSPADCRSCLQDLLAVRQQYLSGRQSGRISGVRCNFRYDLNNKFFTGGPTLRLQTQLWPPPAPAAPNKNSTQTLSPGGRKRTRKRIALATTLSLGVAILAIITFVWLCFWRKRNPARKHVPSYAADTDEDTECANSLLLDIATLRAATDNFVETSEIGQGGFGAVYKKKPACTIHTSFMEAAWSNLSLRYHKVFRVQTPPRRVPQRDAPHSTNPGDIESIDSLLLDISTLRTATDNFADGNRLGEGGFGAVYKGILPDGQEIAVKRLSQSSGQGIQELKNELVLVAKLEHKNLVRLLGVCLQEHEKLLVYEYMPNRSIDTILFDTENRKELDWDNPIYRPTMSTVNVMLSTSTVSLSAPSKPVFFIPESRTYASVYSEYPTGTQSTGKSEAMSPNEVSITELQPR
ncbi:hypothetical protein PR202_ga29719 [Eleusine coracana subsp. coracana]|uniref:Uncharacterized protein n=1 Tax=Eleusine coracana subsp. coracana TaxID=191504 RepID=A0AAV5DMU7_ELECO|nr:hypothetical protein PR202_ga29719 [Eleusine coracana subsp. coracana]